jgi:hypothetical protein
VKVQICYFRHVLFHISLTMNQLCIRHWVALLSSCTLLALTACDKKSPGFIGSDDVIMLTTPASGVESFACADFVSSRSFGLMSADSQMVAWAEGRSLPDDTLRIVRFEVRRDTGVVAQFTLTFRPREGQASEVQCMKGFGCTPPWAHFPWKSPDGDFLDHTTLKFRVVPRGSNGVSFQNYHPSVPITVQVNPAL